MVALSRCLGSVALALVGVEGARIVRESVGRTVIAGVPVLNYDAAYGGQSGSLGELEAQVEQEWVVVVKEGTTGEQLSRMCKASKNACNLIGSPDKGGVPFLEMRGTEQDLEQVIQTGAGAVKYVEPDNEVSMIAEFEGDSDAALGTWGLERIGAPHPTLTGAGSTIFVVDTGVRVSHQEFGGRAAPALDMSSGSPVECNGDTNCARDSRGHGTHCAATAGGKTFGVAPSANIRAVKVDSYRSSWWSDSVVYAALDWVATSSIRPAVAMLSLMQKFKEEGDRRANHNPEAMRDAVDAAVNSGVTVVVTAGDHDNGNACDYSPAFVPSAITVGSTTSNDARSRNAHYGSCVDIWAPGSSVVSAFYSSDTSSLTSTGSSMACAHVSGAAALLLEADPTKKASAIIQEMLDTAYINIISDLTHGDTNALLYVGEGGAPPTPTLAPTPAQCIEGCDGIVNSCKLYPDHCNGCSFC